LTPAVLSPAASPGTAAAPARKDLVWDLATNAIEVELREAPAGDGFELATARARDQVELRNEELGVELLGDDLTYDAATRRLRIFSPSGRPQTLTCDAAKVEKFTKPGAGEAASATASSPPRLHKIVAQEIWALLHENQNARPGEPSQWLLVQFQKDVIGSFPMPPAKGESRYDDLGDTWKMVAEKLTLYLDPSQRTDVPSSLRKTVWWAIAGGNVDFSSGTLRATADRANFEVLENRLTLIGAPARVLRENKRVFEDPEITLRRAGKEDIMEYSGPRRAERREASAPAPPPVPADEKR
jgi:lipopolysaccharide export system protein LptA